jgi:methyltransferase (TIGR00027 family)
MTAMASKVTDKVKGSAFGICSIRTMMSFLPEEAEALCYDKRTPKFEGVALGFNPEPRGSMSTLEGARNTARDYPALVKQWAKEFGEEKTWGGLDFNFCRAHTVDALIAEALAEGSPTRQIVFCGVGQDYRGMRYGGAIHSRGVKVFELDLPPMMDLREKVKARICKVNHGGEGEGRLVLPETYALPIDFDKESVSRVLLACPGYDPTLPTLYLWEGVTYYLEPEAMKSFFQDIHGLMCHAPPDVRKHHSLFFDHLIDLPSLAEKGDLPAAAMLEAFANTEPLISFIAFDKMESYLSPLGFHVDTKMFPPEIYKPYQSTSNEGYRLKGSKYFGMVVAKPK